MSKKYKLGLALSGGGARGFAHLGVLKALEEKGIKPDIISGVSVGSVVGALIADGKTPSQLIKIFGKAGFLNYTQIHVPIDGLLSLDGLVNKIKKEVSVQNLEDLATPLIIGATNLNTGKIEFFDKGPIGTLVKASCSIPILFAPVNIGEHKYADGGVVENVPISALTPLCEKVMAVDIHPTSEVKKIKTMHQIALRVFDIHVAASSRNLFDKCDLLIAPTKVNEYDILDTKNAKNLYKLGYDFTRKIEINF